MARHSRDHLTGPVPARVCGLPCEPPRPADGCAHQHRHAAMAGRGRSAVPCKDPAFRSRGRRTGRETPADRGSVRHHPGFLPRLPFGGVAVRTTVWPAAPRVAPCRRREESFPVHVPGRMHPLPQVRRRGGQLVPRERGRTTVSFETGHRRKRRDPGGVSGPPRGLRASAAPARPPALRMPHARLRPGSCWTRSPR